MQTARRLYLYLLSGIGLGVLVSGLSMLLTVLLEQLGLGPRGELGFGGDDPVRQQLTLASALTVVALPVWLLHWRAVERSVAHDRPDAALERTSGVRGLYFAIALGALLLVAATGLASPAATSSTSAASATGLPARSWRALRGSTTCGCEPGTGP